MNYINSENVTKALALLGLCMVSEYIVTNAVYGCVVLKSKIKRKRIAKKVKIEKDV